ncbi:MAG TPA: tRNA (adenosine(37)-N6)-threonylcarbamoyltransferase complex dimerization subunit type 1 TsaB [Terriglobales bacterium]
MLLVAIDTSGRNGSVALCRGDATSFETLELCTLEGGTYSARLMPCIADLLLRSHVTKSQLDGLSVVDGPGSFTGLRVGLSTVKALCEVLGKPLASVSMLEALAVTHGHDGEVVTAVLDAGRGEVYVGEYQVNMTGAQLVRESMAKLAEFLAQPASNGMRVVTPFPKIAEALTAGRWDVALVPLLQADTIGRIGLRKLLMGNVVDPATLDANYIRRSDAELYSLPKP